MPSIWINKGSTLREIKEIYINRAGTLRDIKEVWINRSGTLRKVFDKIPSLTWNTDQGTLHSSGIPSAPSGATIQFFQDGTVNASINNQSDNNLTGLTWHDRAPSVEPDCDTWTVRIDNVAGIGPQFTSLSEGLDYTMSQSRTYNLENVVSNSEGIYSLEITFDDQNGNVVTKPLSLWMPIGTPP